MSAPEDDGVPRSAIERLADRAVEAGLTFSLRGSLPVGGQQPGEVLATSYGPVTVPRAFVETAEPSLVDVLRERLREALLAEGLTFDPSLDTVRTELDVERNAVAIRVSREYALDAGLIEPTPEESAAQAAQAAEWAEASARRRAEPGPPLTAEALLELLGWEAPYAAHRLHPECHCSTTDWYLCDFAKAQGFTYDDLGRTP